MKNIILSPISTNDLVSQIADEVFLRVQTVLNERNQSRSGEDEFITRKETANILKISLVTLNQWTKKSIVKSYQIGSRVLYKKVEVIAALKEKEQLKGY